MVNTSNPSFKGLLSEQARFLKPISERLVTDWCELYLDTFGRAAFFSTQRVQKIFKELVDIFIDYLSRKDLDEYLEKLKEKGAQFSSLNVPFEEVIVSLHLFEEACLTRFLNAKLSHEKLSDVMLAMGQIHREGLAAIALSYFDDAKNQLNQHTVGLMEENQNLKQDLEFVRDSVLKNTMRELGHMNLAVSGLNQKLRQRVYQLSRIQKITEVLDGESNLSKLFSIASAQVLALCPPHSDIFFGLLDEEKRRIKLHHQDPSETQECGLSNSFFFSEL